jgi:tetratricopeptide (TPR) repeat protein
VRRALPLLLLAFLCVPARALPVSPEMDRLLMDGLDAVYRMDFDRADALADRAVALQPDYPHPYLGRVATDFIRYSYGSEGSDPKSLADFDAAVDRAIAVAAAWNKAHPDDAQGLLALGSAYGISARLALDGHHWLRGWRRGSRAMRYIRASLKADPALYDSYLGLGMFDYYTATIPRFAGWLARIFLGGDRARGLKELRLAATRGRYAKTAAQLILVEIDTEDGFGARNPPEGARLMKAIRAKYPDSAMIHSAEVVALYENGEMTDAVREAREYLARASDGRYPALDLPKGRALLGTLLWADGDREGALAQFRAGADATGAGARTRWAVWSRVRVGQVLDALGRRDEALASYRAAYKEPDRWDFRALIKPCLSRPCVGAKYPGHFSPY